MDEVLDRLKILNYHREVARALGFAPLHRRYFEQPAQNQNEQFYYLATLLVWLLKRCGCRQTSLQQPGQFDDPNATVANLISAIKSLDIPCDYPPSKIRQAHGEVVLTLLTTLTERAMAGHVLKRPQHANVDQKEEAAANDQADIGATLDDDDEIVDEVGASAHQRHATDDAYGGGAVFGMKQQRLRAPSAAAGGKTKVEPWRNEAEWKLEVERVAPLLKVTVANDNKDWRVHLQNLQACAETIDTAWTASKNQMEKLNTDLEQTMEKIQSRESYINQHFEELAAEYRELRTELSTCKLVYNDANERATDLSAELARVTDDLERVKGQIDDIGSGMTDAKPLVLIKQAHAKLKSEMREMDLRMAILEHALRQSRMRTKNDTFQELLRFKFAPGMSAMGKRGTVLR